MQLREDAVARGLSVSEHGITDTESGEVDLCATEEEVYERLGYAYIEPELREGRGELKAAREGKLPELVELGDIRGDLHCHTTLSDGRNTLEEMAAAARDRGYAYLAITDHSASHGFGDHVTAEIAPRADRGDPGLEQGQRGFRLLAGSEINIGLDGSLDYPDDLVAALDWVVASVHTAFTTQMADDGAAARGDREPARRLHRPPDRPPARRREPYAVDIEAVVEAAARTGTMLEINGNPNRRDLSEHHARLAAEAGATIVLNTDAHGVERSKHRLRGCHRPARLAHPDGHRQHPPWRESSRDASQAPLRPLRPARRRWRLRVQRDGRCRVPGCGPARSGGSAEPGCT